MTKKVTAHIVTQTKHAAKRVNSAKSALIFRAVVTALEIVAAILTYKQTGDATTAASVGVLISIIVNILKESGLFEMIQNGGGSDGV